jgi:hypothetical protein
MAFPFNRETSAWMPVPGANVRTTSHPITNANVVMTSK